MITVKPGCVTARSAWKCTAVRVPVSRASVASVRGQCGSTAGGCLSVVTAGTRYARTIRWSTRLHAKFWKARTTNVGVVTRSVSTHVFVVNSATVTIMSAGKAPSWTETLL